MAEPWQKVWRASADMLSTRGLVALRRALVEDDPRLIQGHTAPADPTTCEVRAACAWGYCGWQGDGLREPDKVENYLCYIISELAERFQDQYAYAVFTHWYDRAPRAEMRAGLLAEVEMVLERRKENV